MDIRKINDDISVSPQISIADLPAIKAAGFETIICNRPDGEEPGQPSFAETQQAAQAVGLKTAFLPISSGVFLPEDFMAFRQALQDLPKPILAYCRSGTRSCFLWSGSQIGTLGSDDIITSARSAGYDVTPLIGRA